MISITSLTRLSRRELAALVAAFAVSLPAVTPRIYASDEIQYFSYLRSLWFDRDVSFQNEYEYFYQRNIGRGEGFHATFLEQHTDAGRRPSFATMGSAILWLPFYAIGDLTARSAGDPADGFSYPYIAAVAYGSAFYGFAAVLLSIGAARAIVGSGLLAGILVWLGTPLLFYMYVSPPYSHACSAFAVALFVTIWLHVRRGWAVGGAIALGLSGALMATVREQDAFLALGPAVDFFVTAFVLRDGSFSVNQSSRSPTSARASLAHTRSAGAAGAADTALGNNHRRPGTAVRAAVLIGAAGCFSFFAGILPQLLAYKALNGRFGPSTLVTRKMSWESPNALNVLASPEHGFFIWTPLALIAIAGLAILAVRGSSAGRRVGMCALLMVALQVYVSGSVDSWTVAGAFGQRRFVALTILLTIGLAASLAFVREPEKEKLGIRRVALGVVLVLCVWWNVALMAEFGTGLMNRQRLELRRNAYDAFVTLPRMLPDLVRRYLFDRESFYKQRP